jgi:hypothetical protein
MSKLILSDLNNNEISLEDSLVLKAFVDGSVTVVQYIDEVDGYRKTIQTNTALASVGALSAVLTATTDLGGTSVWVNKNRVVGVSEASSLATLRFDNSGSSPESIKLNVTSAAWNNAVIAKEGGFSYLLDSFTAAPNVVKVDASEGDVSAKFVAGEVFTVFGEGDANDTIFEVVSVAFSTTTNVTVVETPIVNASASGYSWVK